MFGVDPRQRQPLVDFMLDALRAGGCAILNRSPADEAPFRISFLTPWGERVGIVAYAFLANSRATKNRPADEWRFQLKYGSRDGAYHQLWQDPFGLYTTICLGIDPQCGFFVGADPVLNSPTRFFISKEFKQHHVDVILRDGWHAWERYVQPRRVQLARAAVSNRELFEVEEGSFADGHEVLVGGTAEHFLRYVLFERDALGEEQGHRQLVAEQAIGRGLGSSGMVREGRAHIVVPSSRRMHELEREFDLGHDEIMALIASAPRLKMAVRGWVAESHLRAQLAGLGSVEEVVPIEEDGRPDFLVRIHRARRPVLVECKNVLRATDRHGRSRLDFMRTRASPADRCSRYYSSDEFQVLVACLHARTERWEFAAHSTATMRAHRSCSSRLDHRVIIDETWSPDLETVLREAAA
jgi:hypothetical protein